MPWQNLSKDGSDKVRHEKEKTSPNDICKGLEPEFCKFLNYARNLDYTEKPDYLKLKKMFTDLYNRKGYAKDGILEWSPRFALHSDKKQELAKKKALENEKLRKRKEEEEKAQKPSKKRKMNIPPPPAENMLLDKFASTPEVGAVPCKPKTRKEINAELTALAEKQARQEQGTSMTPIVTKSRKEINAELTALAQKQAEQEQSKKSPSIVTPEAGVVPCKPKIKKVNIAAITTLAQKQAQQEQFFYFFNNRNQI